MGREVCDSCTFSEDSELKVLVTGATGFIGNYVIEDILKRGFEVVATSIDSEEEVKKFSWFSKVKYIPWDLNIPREDFFSFFKKPDLLIHLAWEKVSDMKSLIHIEKNLFSNYFFIKKMIESGLKDVSVTGTCVEYGMKEGCLNEEMETNPILPYAIAKDSLRRFVQELGRKYDFNFKWIRLFYMYGKGQNPQSILSQLDKALENNEEVFDMSRGEQLRDYLPVEKVAEYIVRIATQKKINGVINCCSGEPISIRELVENHLKKRGKHIKLNLGYYPYPNDEPMKFWGDTTKLNKVLSTSP